MHPDMDARLAALEERIGTEFKNKLLLLEAVTHRSYINEYRDHPVGHNERLEFLGDAVLEMIVTDHLYKRFPEKPEGALTNWRAALVNTDTLAAIAQHDLGIDAYLYLSRGEAKDAGSKARHHILANAFEAILGAVYLDGGMPAATLFVDSTLLYKAKSIFESSIDFKSHFQEVAQERWRITPEYSVLAESGPDHDRTFRVGVKLRNRCVAEGVGKSKREGHVAAAEAALKTISSWESLFSEREQSPSDKSRSGKAGR